MMNLNRIQEGIELVLEGLGVDPKDPNYEHTPARVARMYYEMFTPDTVNYKTFPGGSYGEMIVMRGHTVFGVCPHHLLPIEYRCYAGYIPADNGYVLGLSKLARIFNAALTGPLMQEEFTDRAANLLSASLSSDRSYRGIAIVVAGIHGCMKYRGVRSEADTVTSHMFGVFRDDHKCRDEFFRIIGRP
jgi:GTP cyclohydrolase I